jgi:hypothetical protein
MPVSLSAFLLCDSVARDAGTGKAIINGVFDRIWTRALPAVHASMAFYFRLVFDDPAEPHRFSLRYESPSHVQQMMGPELNLNVGATGVAEGAMNIQGFVLPEAGQYRFSLFVDGEVVGDFIMTVELTGLQGGQRILN